MNRGRCAGRLAGEPRPRFNARGRRRAKVHTLWDGRAVKAFLRLRGVWLERLGFVAGQELEIEEGPGAAGDPGSVSDGPGEGAAFAGSEQSAVRSLP
jgi:hypothetical protein